ncbi:hypothetical protein BGX27_004957, partial [Mortierella sp. AM989]
TKREREDDTARKRDRDEEEGSSSKRTRLDLDDAVVDAVKAAGLSELDNKQRRLVLEFMGRRVGRKDPFRSLTSTALKLRGANFKPWTKCQPRTSPRFQLSRQTISTSDRLTTIFTTKSLRNLAKSIYKTLTLGIISLLQEHLGSANRPF